MSSSRWSRLPCMLAVLFATIALDQSSRGDEPKPKQPVRDKPVTTEATFALFGLDAAEYGKAAPEAVWDRVLVARVQDEADETLGATLQPVGDVLRTQLNLPTGQGLLVASLRGDSPSAQAGLKQNDILLSLADKPLAAAEDLTKELKAAGEATVPLKVVRAGKPLTIQVRPVYRVTLSGVKVPKTEYYFGISIEAADDALRAQLDLPAGQGVVINDVIAGSPAEKAGVHKHDIVLELGGQPVGSIESLTSKVQAAQDRPTTLKVLRGGKPVSIPITGAVREVKAGASYDEAVRFWMVNQQFPVTRAHGKVALVDSGTSWTTAATRTLGLQQRLDHLEQELKALRRLEALEKDLKALREAVDKVNEYLKAGKESKRE